MNHFKKKRKPRTTSKDMNFDGSHMFGQSIPNTIAANKILHRHYRLKVCIGCGEKKCRCKSKS